MENSKASCIASAAMLQSLQTEPAGHDRLSADIDLAGALRQPADFCGTPDKNRHKTTAKDDGYARSTIRAAMRHLNHKRRKVNQIVSLRKLRFYTMMTEIP